MITTVQAQVGRELELIPKGDLPQQEFRSHYNAARLNSLGRKPELEPTRRAAVELATAVVRKHHPDFVPHLDPRLLGCEAA